MLRLSAIASSAARLAVASRSFSSSAAVLANQKYFDKILIANRGEIACRVMNTAKRLGIKTVAVYSTADANAKFVRMADEAVCVGPPASLQSYLVQDHIVEAVRMTGAQAVHPGYGFLSTNSSFAERLEKENIVFIGPPASAIKAMGYKIESKKIALAAKVNTVPGFAGKVANENDAADIAEKIGFPVMIKADAGGGGKGIRIAHTRADIHEAFRASKEEAASAFGNADVLVEKFVNNGPRHIEIQVLADKHGNAIYLNERECSIQRRNQKVVEEAPSVPLTPEIRKAMGEQAVALCKAVKYYSAGTVEFLVDADLKFYFLEMNTRLQVEHPITEKITGVDIVEQMIRVAAGHPLAYSQKDIKINGWSFESRVYAENPYRDFLPSIGKLQQYVEPMPDHPDVRCDSGIVPGSEISIYYDPLICKLVTWGKDRATAAEVMRQALDSYVIRGVQHNIPFLREVFQEPKFLAGDVTTNYIPEHFPDGFKGHQLSKKERTELIAAAASIHHLAERRRSSVSGQLESAEQASLEDAEERTYVVGLHGKQYNVKLSAHGALVDIEDVVSKERASINLDDVVPNEHESPVFRAKASSASGQATPSSMIVQVIHQAPLDLKLQYIGSVYDLTVFSPRHAALLSSLPAKAVKDMSKFIVSPMPGKVVSMLVKPGQKVAPGEAVAIIEAMKMQNVIYAPETAAADGSESVAFVVKKANVNSGATVSADEMLIEFE